MTTNHHEVVVMAEYLENKKIVQANSLVRQTSWTLNLTPLKLFKACVSAIDTSNPPKDNTVVMHKSDLIQLLEIGKKQNYVYLKNQLRSLITSVKIEEDDKHERYCALVNDIYWEKDSDIVKIEFHKAVMPYLVELHSRFLEYPAELIPSFDSKYGLIIYESLLSNWKQYADSNEFTYDVDTLRYITGTEKLYERWGNFEERVLKTAVENINHIQGEFLVKYEKIRHGRTIEKILFRLVPRTSWKQTTYEEAALALASKVNNKKDDTSDEEGDIYPW
jgi:plasmid replication initiation protein